MVAVALLLGRDQDVRLGGGDPVPEEQLRPQQDEGLGALPHAEEGQVGGGHRVLRRWAHGSVIVGGFYASRAVCFICAAVCFQLSKQHALFAYLLLISFILCKHEKTAESVLPFPCRLPLLQQRFTIAMAWWKFAWTWGFIEQLCNRYLNAWQQQTWWQVLKSFSEAPIDFWGVETSTWAFTRWLNR